MGMYTELHYNAELKKEVPKQILDVLAFMVEYENDTPPPHLPSSKLFGDTRWRYMLTCDSYYFCADTHSTLRFDNIAKSWFLCIRSNFKNYDNEINLFIEWMDPYLQADSGDFIGFYRYEEDEIPTLIYKK